MDIKKIWELTQQKNSYEQEHVEPLQKDIAVLTQLIEDSKKALDESVVKLFRVKKGIKTVMVFDGKAVLPTENELLDHINDLQQDIQMYEESMLSTREKLQAQKRKAAALKAKITIASRS